MLQQMARWTPFEVVANQMLATEMGLSATTGGSTVRMHRVTAEGSTLRCSKNSNQKTTARVTKLVDHWTHLGSHRNKLAAGISEVLNNWMGSMAIVRLSTATRAARPPMCPVQMFPLFRLLVTPQMHSLISPPKRNWSRRWLCKVCRSLSLAKNWPKLLPIISPRSWATAMQNCWRPRAKCWRPWHSWRKHSNMQQSWTTRAALCHRWLRWTTPVPAIRTHSQSGWTPILNKQRSRSDREAC